MPDPTHGRGPRRRSIAFAVTCGRLALIGLCLALAGGCGMPSLLITPVSGDQSLDEVVVERGGRRGGKIALIEVEGMLTNARAGGPILGASENKVSLFQQQLDAAAADKRVRAVILRVNSPGGTVAASDAMYHAVLEYKKRTGRPVIVAVQDVCASGAYFIAAGADEIHATPTSLVGSIGVIFQTFDVSALLAKIGVKVEPLVSGPLKDLGSPFNGLSQEEREVMQGLIDEFYGRFTGVVTSHRAIVDRERAFDGRIFSGVAANDIGLVDRVLYLPETIRRTRELIGDAGATVIMYKRPYGYTGSIYASAPLSPPTAGPGEPPVVLDVPGLAEVAARAQPGFYYLWNP